MCHKRRVPQLLLRFQLSAECYFLLLFHCSTVEPHSFAPSDVSAETVPPISSGFPIVGHGQFIEARSFDS